MHCVGGSISPTVPATMAHRTGDGVPLRMSGQETPSESSEADSSECDTTGDEDGWESGESSASLVGNHHQHHHQHPLTHSSSRKHVSSVLRPRVSLKETAKCLLSRGDKSRSSGSRQNSAGDAASAKRSSAPPLARSATLDT